MTDAKHICLYILMLLSVTTLMAQDEKITFSRQSLSTREAIAEIKNQTVYHFAINHAVFDDNKVVYFTNITLPLKDALNQLLAETNHTYIIYGRQILILTIKEKQEQETKPTSHKQPEEAKHLPVKDPPPIIRRDKNDSYQQIDIGFEQDIRNRISQQQRFPISNQINYEKSVKDTLVFEGTHLWPDRTFSIIPVGYPMETYNSYLTEAPARFLVKTNLLYGSAALTPNLGVEIGLNRKLSLELMVGWNPFNKEGTEEDNKKFNHVFVKPELRYWLCERSNGHFFGVHPFFANYNISGRKVPLLFEKEYRYEGNGYGIGVSYGYHWMLSKRWGLEFNVGVGAAFLDYKKFCHEKCSDKLGDFEKKYFGPTAAGIKLIYIIK